MKYINEKLAWEVRKWIYLAGIVVFVLSFFIASPKSNASSPSLDQESFWPPDMVPHPNPPWDQPKDDSEGDLA